MLRITTHDLPPMTSFVLEGKLVGPWVKELEKCWEKALAADSSRAVLVNLAVVTFIDSEGRALLARMRREGARLQSTGVLINAIVAEIETEETKAEKGLQPFAEPSASTRGDQTMNNPIVYILAIIILLASPVIGLAQQKGDGASGEVLTLEEAISLAFRDNRQIKNAQLAVGNAGDAWAATRTHRLPSLNVYSLASQQLVKQNAGLDNSETNILPGIGPFFSIGISRRPTAIVAGQILQPLSQQYRIGLNIKQAGLARDVESEKLRQVRQSMVDEVKRTYYGILRTQSAFDSLLEAVKYYRELDRVMGDNVAQQVSLKSDSLEVKTRLAKTEYEALNLANQLTTGKEQLNNLLGRDVRAEFRVAPVPDVNGIDADLAHARSLALDQRPEVREARLKVKQAEVDRRIKKSEYIPDVGIGFTYMTFRNFDQVVPKNTASIGVAMKWEVFDWGRKKNQLAEKDKTIEQARNALREAESLVLIEVGDKFRKLQQTRQALVVAQLKQETARENMRVSTSKYKVEAALLSDVLQTQATLADAGYQYQQALLSFWTARADYEKAIGADK